MELEDSLQSPERLLTAAVVIADGDVDRFALRSASRARTGATSSWPVGCAMRTGLASWTRDCVLGSRWSVAEPAPLDDDLADIDRRPVAVAARAEEIWTASRPPNTTAVRPSEGRAVGYRLLATDV